jgi:glutamate synthase (NADPH/NADH) small chain
VIGLRGDGGVEALVGRRVTGSTSRDLVPVERSEFELPADLVLIAIGFLHPAHDDVVAALGLELDRRGNLAARTFETSHPGVYAAGDARVGQSLIVTAFADGRRCARAIDRQLRAGPASG